jgi:hypothetical protein
MFTLYQCYSVLEECSAQHLNKAVENYVDHIPDLFVVALKAVFLVGVFVFAVHCCV